MRYKSKELLEMRIYSDILAADIGDFMTDLEARIDRLESLDAIRQLVSKYALSLDMRDVDAHVNLFAEDIRVSREESGRPALKVWLDAMMRDQLVFSPAIAVLLVCNGFE